ncbi:MAG: hypothetical protein RL329_544 [Bacteroidota bacterium]|jgi:hypothetical protein
MTYIVKLLDPRAQSLLEALATMNLVELAKTPELSLPIPIKRDKRSVRKAAQLEGIAESLREVKAHQRGEIELQTLSEFLKELD